MTVIDEIAAERRRQIDEEGFDLSHDDRHDKSEIAYAAACYVLAGAQIVFLNVIESLWPWDRKWWKPQGKKKRRLLIIASALIVAEIERLDRRGARVSADPTVTFRDNRAS